jgi:hypothetical protein
MRIQSIVHPKRRAGLPRAVGAAGAIALVLVPIFAFNTLGCGGGPSRAAKTPPQLLTLRVENDGQFTASVRTGFGKMLQRTKAEYDEYKAGRRPAPPTIDALVVSGGGDWGAFGAGFLKGWNRVPKDHPLAKPEFDAVSGVSTGALIAPFAFLGDDASIDRIEHLYRNPKPDWVKKRGWLYFLPNNISFAEVPGLERELRDAVTPELVRRIAEEGATGRALMVNTTNLDDGGPQVFDLVAEARRATDTGNLDRIRNVMLASAGIPGAFPYRELDDQMFVDGGVTSNIIYGGRVSDEDSLPAVWQRTYPDTPIPKIRFWILLNNKVRPLPQVTPPHWPDIVTRSMELSVRASTLTGIRHLYAIAEIAKLKRHADFEVRVVSVPTDWVAPKPGDFQAETMDNLADIGERMGADPNSWADKSP